MAFCKACAAVVNGNVMCNMCITKDSVPAFDGKPVKVGNLT
jgi:hypothetical protein